MGRVPIAVSDLRGRGADGMRTFRLKPDSNVVCLVPRLFRWFGRGDKWGRSCDSSSDGEEEGPVSVSLSGGKKPMPGVRGV